LLKSHNCGEMNKAHLDCEVSLAGWVNRRRNHGGLIFIDLRDREGTVQVVFNPELAAACHELASELRSEYVIRVTGRVALRPAGTENPKLPTGEIEVIAAELEILSRAKTPPFYINEESEVEESIRLKYRYLDLRRARMKRNLILRHRIIKFIRDFLDGQGFIEVETPILIKSTPEGARDYLVPSRVHTGKFYALPQSPQQLKQLLMVAGVEKYFQIARCFRDEDTRADRQPEFTQLDLEMSFVNAEDIIRLMESLFIQLAETANPGMQITKPFNRLSYAEAMARFGSDKPDLRFGMELKDIADIAAGTDFVVFKSALEAGGQVKGITVPSASQYSRKQLDELNALARSHGAGGLVTIALSPEASDVASLTTEQVKSAAAKFLTLEQIKEIAGRLEAGPGDLLLIVAGKPAVVATALGELRLEMGQRLELADPNLLAFAFITDFPLLHWSEKAGRWEAEHHPFTSPVTEDIARLDEAPAEVRGQHYDIVLNGYEIGGGSIRIHQSELQRRVFRLLGYTDSEIDSLFGHLLGAFDYGAPPHGGIAVGIDRVVMLLAAEKTIREVIAFPKTQEAMDLTFDAPSPVSEAQLTELHLRLREEE